MGSLERCVCDQGGGGGGRVREFFDKLTMNPNLKNNWGRGGGGARWGMVIEFFDKESGRWGRGWGTVSGSF